MAARFHPYDDEVPKPKRRRAAEIQPQPIIRRRPRQAAVRAMAIVDPVGPLNAYARGLIQGRRLNE